MNVYLRFLLLQLLTRMHEKHVMVSNSDIGHNVSTVNTLMRKHEGFERDIVALEPQVLALHKEAERLVLAFPAQSSGVQEKDGRVMQSFEDLRTTTASRKLNLQAAFKLQTFLVQCTYLLGWVESFTGRMKAQQLPQDMTASDSLLHQHQVTRGGRQEEKK
jgi:spectrin alpha